MGLDRPGGSPSGTSWPVSSSGFGTATSGVAGTKPDSTTS